MTVKVVTQFNPVWKLGGTNLIFTGLQPPNVTWFTTPGASKPTPNTFTGTGQPTSLTGTINTTLVPGRGGIVVVYNESKVGITLFLPDSSVLYLPPLTARKFEIAGPKITFDFAVENNANSYANIYTSPLAATQQLAVVNPWGVVTVETYDSDIDPIPQWDFQVLDSKDTALTQWRLLVSANANTTPPTITNLLGGSIIFLKYFTFTVATNATATSSTQTMTLSGINQIDTGAQTLYFNYNVNPSSAVTYTYDFAEEPLSSAPNTNLVYTFANTANTFISFFARYINQ